MILETERLVLRPWTEDDAAALYQYARDPQVGPIAGWPPHTSEENSLEIIKTVLSAPQTYAVILRETAVPVGSIGLMMGTQSNLPLQPDEGELGYWIGVPYWGQGLIPEAVRALLHYGFEEMGLTRMFCGYFDGNEKSRRVQEKCGFVFHHTDVDVPWPLMHDIRTEHITCLTREAWRAGLQSLVDGLTGRNQNTACRCLSLLEQESAASPAVYPYFGIFADLLDGASSYARTRGFLLLTANAKWDTEHKLDAVLPRYLGCVLDKKPITVRQCVKALPRLAAYRPDLGETIVRTLHSVDPFRYADSMQPLVLKDIQAALDAIDA